jgi:hypothetical protein
MTWAKGSNLNIKESRRPGFGAVSEDLAEAIFVRESDSKGFLMIVLVSGPLS